MKKLFLLLTLALSFQLKAQPKKILFIGNSYVYTNNLPQVLYNLALANGDSIIYDSSVPGGYTFQLHTTNATTLSKISAQDWDYVVLQEQSQMPSFPPSQVQTETYPYAQQLNDLILANDSCTETVFFMTWGRKYGDASNCANYPPLCTFEGMQARLRQSYIEMADNNQALVAPVGEAFKYARMADSTINLYSPDNSHPSLAGTYLAACTFYATLFETSPIGIAYNAGLTGTQASFLQQIAYQTVFDSLAVWNINEFEPHANISQISSSGPQFQFASNSTNVNQYLWSNGETSNTANYTFTTLGLNTISLIASNGCSSDTAFLDVMVSTLSNVYTLQNKSIQLYLQKENLTININDNTLYNLKITDSMGKLVFTMSNQCSQNLNINTSNWSKGIYFVQAIVNTQVYTQKIFIP
ncbi:MAG TPA: T9SS type A sorting domain-containing protein [Bacteroidia bacterium]|nr:T9SS type A sorting domain-containing protein [Bacteroidia bacterium]